MKVVDKLTFGWHHFTDGVVAGARCDKVGTVSEVGVVCDFVVYGIAGGVLFYNGNGYLVCALVELFTGAFDRVCVEPVRDVGPIAFMGGYW